MYKVLGIEKHFQMEIKRATITTEIIIMNTVRQRCITEEDTKESTVLEENQKDQINQKVTINFTKQLQYQKILDIIKCR